MPVSRQQHADHIFTHLIVGACTLKAHPFFALLQTELAIMGFPKFLNRRRSANQEYDDVTEESSLNMSVARPEEPYAVERMFNSVFMSESDSITEGTSVTQSVAVKTVKPKEPSALANFFNSTSTAVGSALAGAAATAATMAGEVAQDMGEIIMADEKQVAAAQANGGAIPKEKKSTEEKKATSDSILTSAVAVTRSRSSASAKNVKENIAEEDGGEVQAEKAATSKLTGVIEMKRSRSTASAKKMDKTNAKQPTSSKSKAQGTSAFVINPNKNGKQQKKQPTSSGNVVKGSPATLAKLMTKLDKKRKLIKKLEQQIEQAEVEMADTKKSIRALAAKFRGVLDGDSVQDQTRDEIVADAKSEGYQSRDDDVSEVSSLESEVSEESEWGVSELAGFYNSEQLKRLELVISETMAIESPMIPETV